MERSVPAPVEVPKFFVCPISLEIMRDPVTLSSGITYDRDSIERWVFNGGHGDCPVTKLPLGASGLEPTPNHTLRRLIQAWCAAQAVERFPTQRPPVDAYRVAAIVDEANRGGQQELLASLRELADIVGESDRNRRCVEGAPGAVEFLVSVVKKHAAGTAKLLVGSQAEMYGVLDSPKASSPEEAALSILHSVKLSEESLKRVLDGSDDFLDTLASVLRWPSYRSRTYGIHLLKAALSAMTPSRLSSASTELVEAVVRVVTDRTLSPKAIKVALHVLCRLCPWGRNRIKAVEAGAVAALVELLLNEGYGGSNGRGGKRTCELTAVAMDHLCGCAEGRLELVEHPAGLAVVARAATRLSPTGTESAVRTLHAVARHSATPAVLQEMLAVGVVARLLYLVQAGVDGERPRERAREMLKMHARVWRGSPCLASHLESYPC
ncbi:E3 ubiquitin-protein ligase PUB23-like [Phragmites australis]|uniref:E3 ubiquitin-protein ligase PUB23-like n=1 Tax=Phragmites australis TaxID=29695 RepID=UPI002D765C3F|nr:E3 ubiquitin-protein ligase PUB23-like [Phragmites australis]